MEIMTTQSRLQWSNFHPGWVPKAKVLEYHAWPDKTVVTGGPFILQTPLEEWESLQKTLTHAGLISKL